MQKSTVEGVILELEQIRSRIGMYIHPVDVANARSFMAGFTVGTRLLGLRGKEGLWWKVQESRGWRQAPTGPVPQMREKGLSESQIVGELIDIEIEVFRQSELAT